MLDLIRAELGIIQDGPFEKLVRRVLPRFKVAYELIEPTYNYKGKVTKGPVDLYCYKSETDTYTAFICTTQISGVKSKIIDDIHKLNSDVCHIRDKIDEVVICVNTCIKSEVEEYRTVCREYGWQCIPFSLERLSCLIDENPDISNDICSVYIQQVKDKIERDEQMFEKKDIQDGTLCTKQYEKMYSCGKRVLEVRKDIQISSSRFIDLIEFNSEKYLARVENDEVEVSESQIHNISQKTGVSYRWLKHSEGFKYDYETIATSGIEKIEKIKFFNPKSLYFLINESNMSILLIAHIDDYNWKMFTFTFNLDFWNWFGDEHYIPEIFKLFEAFHREFGHTIVGRIINSKLYERATSGNEHFSKIIESSQGYGQHWFDDIMDVTHKYPIASNYADWYGEWFVRIQNHFKRYAKI